MLSYDFPAENTAEPYAEKNTDLSMAWTTTMQKLHEKVSQPKAVARLGNWTLIQDLRVSYNNNDGELSYHFTQVLGGHEATWPGQLKRTFLSVLSW